MSEALAQDVWEDEIYAQKRQLNRWPFDAVVSFLLRQAARDKPRAEQRVLELGCGAGNNLWCAALEGFAVSGVDRSARAIEAARARLEGAGLTADLRVASMECLPFADESFDLVFERAALSCLGDRAAGAALGEIARVACRGARVLLTPYSSACTSAECGESGPDGRVQRILGGSLQGVGPLRFWRRDELEALVRPHFRLQGLEHSELSEKLGSRSCIHGEWRVLLERR